MVVFRILYSIYTLLVFFVFAIPILFAYLFLKLLPYKKQIGGAYFLNRILVFSFSIFTFYRYKIKGLDKIIKNHNCIVIVNHYNVMDMIAIAYGCRVNAKPLVKKELGKIPILGQLFQIACLTLDRKSEESREKAQMKMKWELENGGSILIFPEGTRNRSDAPLKSFYNGAFELSLQTGIPILPIVLTNIRKITDADSLIVRPGIIELNYLDPIFPANFEKSSVEILKEKCFQVMEDFLIENDDHFKTYRKQS